MLIFVINLIIFKSLVNLFTIIQDIIKQAECLFKIAKKGVKHLAIGLKSSEEIFYDLDLKQDILKLAKQS